MSDRINDLAATVQRIRIHVEGAVQGMGFRPFVYRLAHALGLSGWVENTPQSLCLEVEGRGEDLEIFCERLRREAPAQAVFRGLMILPRAPEGKRGFRIRNSRATGRAQTLILPDLAACPQCVAELFDPGDRRYRYPFINCTQCGPRYSILHRLPYERPNTTMRDFRMCSECLREYRDPADRRFHAQPNACAACGPQTALWDPSGRILEKGDGAVRAAAEAIAEGRIVAVRGLGGFHLMVDALSDDAVGRLRERKHRPEKPFALIYPSLARIRDDAAVSDPEAELLLSSAAPIVLLRSNAEFGFPISGCGMRIAERNLAGNDEKDRDASHGPSFRSGSIPHSAIRIPHSVIPPGHPFIGAMLPYTPLHHLLMATLGRPVVATSGNLSEEPICIDPKEALRRLSGIADLFLVHDRPILRRLDDSVVKVIGGEPTVLRLGRGYAPGSIPATGSPATILATGGHLKNTVAVRSGREILISPHVGDLDNEAAAGAFVETIQGLLYLRGLQPDRIARDLHPDYFSSRWAGEQGVPVFSVQHHHAHVVSCMAEHRLEGRVLGVAWDGTGYGPDGTVWGGEFLLATEDRYERAGSLRSFPLPGGEKAVREPRRAALGLLYAIRGEKLFEKLPIPLRDVFTKSELMLLRTMLEKNIQTVVTTSAGRLFDAVASLLGLCYVATFEGQAALALEGRADATARGKGYRMRIADCGLRNDIRKKERNHLENGPRLLVDWEPMIREILFEIEHGAETASVATKFHEALAEAVVSVAAAAGERRVVLSGGCFQNRPLTELAVRRLREEGFEAYRHLRIPPNDGGIAAGQAMIASRRLSASAIPAGEIGRPSGGSGDAGCV